MKKLLILPAFIVAVWAATTGLDTAVRIQDGTDSRDTKSSRVTVLRQTNLLAGTLTATSSITAGAAGQRGVLTIENSLNETNSSGASINHELGTGATPSLAVRSSGGVTATVSVSSGGHANFVSSSAALFLGPNAGVDNLTIIHGAIHPNTSGDYPVNLGAKSLTAAFSNLCLQGSVNMVRTQALNFYGQAAGTPVLLFSLDATNGVQSRFRTLTDGATVTITCDVAQAFQHDTVTLGGNRTLAISGAVSGMEGTLIVKQDGTGSRTLTLPATSKVINGGAGAITLTTTASAIDVLTWVYDGSNYLWTYGKNFN